MLLANKRLPYGNQILARMSFRENKNFEVRPCSDGASIPKKNYMRCFCDEILLAGAAVPLFNRYK